MSDPRKSKPKDDLAKDARTAEILDAARLVIERVGIADASMEQIAHEAGIAKGTIYLYFANREDLLVQVVRRSFEQIMQSTREATDRAHGAVAKLRAWIETALGQTAERRAFFEAVGEHAGVPAETAGRLARESEAEVEEYTGFVAGFIELGVADGVFRPCKTTLVARMMIWSLRAAIRERYAEEHPTPSSEEAELLVGLFLNGIASRDG